MNPYPDHFVISYHNDLWFYDDSCCDFTMVTMITLWSRALPPAAIFTAPIKLGVIAHPQPLRPRFLPLGVFVHHLVGDGSHRVDHRVGVISACCIPGFGETHYQRWTVILLVDVIAVISLVVFLRSVFCFWFLIVRILQPIRFFWVLP